MKNLIQKYFMAIVAVMMVAGFSAFKATDMITTDPGDYKIWYFTSNNPTEVTEAGEYSLDPDDLIPCEGVEEVICKILAPDLDEDGKPDLHAPSDPNNSNSPQIQVLILDAMDNLGLPNDSVLSFRELD